MGGLRLRKVYIMSHADRDSPRKDFWDKLDVLGGPLIALVGILFTLSYNLWQAQQQHQREYSDQQARESEARQRSDTERNRMYLQRLETVSRFFPAITGEDQRHRKVAILLINSLGDQELALRFGTLDPSKGSNEAIDAIFASATSPEAAQQPSPVAPAPTPASSLRGQGWVYLGDYDRAQGSWRTRYLVFGERTEPGSLMGSALRVRAETGPLNVRAGMPSIFGSLAATTDALKPGIEVKVREVKAWQNSGFYWAKVEYR